MANSVDPQCGPIGAVCYGSTLFPYIPNWSVMLGNYLQQSTSAEDIFRCIFFLALYGLIREMIKKARKKVVCIYTEGKRFSNKLWAFTV